jgi:protein tyrosine/serine phosphatase
MNDAASKLRRPAARKWVALGLPLLLAAGAGGGSLYQIHVRHRLGTVTPGKVYKSGTMPPAEMAKVAHELGLRTVIDLRTFQRGQDSTNTTDLQVIQAEGAALGSVGVRHIHLPTPQVPTEETVDQFLKVMNDPANLPTLIHCYHGIGRTELFVAVYRMEFEHWSNEKARSATRLLLAGSSFSDKAEKGQFLIQYKPHLAEVVKR